MRKHPLKIVALMLVLALFATAFLAWHHQRTNKPIIRFVEYRYEEMRISGPTGDTPYRFRKAVFRITNPSNHSYSYQTIGSKNRGQPFCGSRIFYKNGEIKTHPPMLDCGLQSMDIVEITPKSSVEFTIPASSFSEPGNSYAIGILFKKGTPADFEKSHARNEWSSFIRRLMDRFLDRIHPDRFPGACWSDVVPTSSPDPQ